MLQANISDIGTQDIQGTWLWEVVVCDETTHPVSLELSYQAPVTWSRRM